jgi:cell division septum initiation protein DivIVA
MLPGGEFRRGSQMGDRDELLIRIDERLQQFLEGHKKQRDDIKELRTDVDGLLRAKVQVYTVASAVAFAISLLIRIFWPH